MLHAPSAATAWASCLFAVDGMIIAQGIFCVNSLSYKNIDISICG
jgi:hypothetical protein